MMKVSARMEKVGDLQPAQDAKHDRCRDSPRECATFPPHLFVERPANSHLALFAIHVHTPITANADNESRLLLDHRISMITTGDC